MSHALTIRQQVALGKDSFTSCEAALMKAACRVCDPEVTLSAFKIGNKAVSALGGDWGVRDSLFKSM